MFIIYIYIYMYIYIYIYYNQIIFFKKKCQKGILPEVCMESGNGSTKKLDDIDLLCEISIFSSCEINGLCCVCKKHMK